MRDIRKGNRGYMNLVDANIGEEYIVDDIVTDDEELNSFLFSLIQ